MMMLFNYFVALIKLIMMIASFSDSTLFFVSSAASGKFVLAF